MKGIMSRYTTGKSGTYYNVGVGQAEDSQYMVTISEPLTHKELVVYHMYVSNARDAIEIALAKYEGVEVRTNRYI